MSIRLPVTAAALAVVSAFSAHAADSVLTPIVVTATRQPVRTNELLSDTAILTREDIERARPLQTLGELLAQEGGVEFSSLGGAGSPASMFIRGANSGHTLLLVDGMRVGSATLGEPTISAIPLEQIERIEILKGPASSLYGSDAIGGVIQVFTRQGDGPARVSGSVATGSHGTHEASFGITGANERIRYSARIGTIESDGFNAIRNPRNASYNNDKDGYNNLNFAARVSAMIAAGHEIELQGFHSNNQRHYDAVYYDASFNARTDYDFTARTVVDSVAASMKNRLGENWTSQLRLGRSVDDHNDHDGPGSRSRFRTRQDQLVWQHDVKIPYGALLLAAESLRQGIDSTGTYTVKDRTINSLLAGWTGYLDKHRLQLNLRNDRNSQFGERTTGSAAYGYQLNDRWRLRTSYATAFKAPTFNDLYFPNSPMFGGGNPNLRPESARNREIGLNYESAASQAAITVYRNDVDNLIQWRPDDLADPWSPWHPTNVGAARLQGITLTARHVLGTVTLRGSMDFQDHRDTATDLQLVLRSRRHGTLGFDHRIGKLSWGADLFASGARFNDAANTRKLGGYATLGLHADYRLERSLTLFARAGNLFDRSYELRQDYANAGRTVFVGVRYEPR